MPVPLEVPRLAKCGQSPESRLICVVLNFRLLVGSEDTNAESVPSWAKLRPQFKQQSEETRAASFRRVFRSFSCPSRDLLNAGCGAGRAGHAIGKSGLSLLQTHYQIASTTPL